MARYYIEKEIADGRISHIIVQNESGVFKGYTDGVIQQIATVYDYRVKFPEWTHSREVSTTSLEYLEYTRLFERNSYTTTKATEIQEEEATVKEIVERILTKGR